MTERLEKGMVTHLITMQSINSPKIPFLLPDRGLKVARNEQLEFSQSGSPQNNTRKKHKRQISYSCTDRKSERV